MKKLLLTTLLCVTTVYAGLVDTNFIIHIDPAPAYGAGAVWIHWRSDLLVDTNTQGYFVFQSTNLVNWQLVGLGQSTNLIYSTLYTPGLSFMVQLTNKP